MRNMLAGMIFACLLPVGDVKAFLFSDGTTLSCSVDGMVVAELIPPVGDSFYDVPRTGLVTRDGGVPRILWNAPRLAQLPPEVHDFLFFHECAHARISTTDELTANCAGLVDMRAAGRAGPEFERQLRGYFPRESAYWNETFACANRETSGAAESGLPHPAK